MHLDGQVVFAGFRERISIVLMDLPCFLLNSPCLRASWVDALRLRQPCFVTDRAGTRLCCLMSSMCIRAVASMQCLTSALLFDIIMILIPTAVCWNLHLHRNTCLAFVSQFVVAMGRVCCVCGASANTAVCRLPVHATRHMPGNTVQFAHKRVPRLQLPFVYVHRTYGRETTTR